MAPRTDWVVTYSMLIEAGESNLNNPWVSLAGQQQGTNQLMRT